MPATNSHKAWAGSVPQFPLLSDAHPACVNVNCRSARGLHSSNHEAVQTFPLGKPKCVFKCVCSHPTANRESVKPGLCSNCLSPSPGLLRKQSSLSKLRIYVFFYRQDKPQYQWPRRSDSAQSHSEMHKGSGPCCDSGSHLNHDP